MEIIFIGALALILIGPEQLPDVARAIVKFINELKRASHEITQSFNDVKSSTSNYMNQVMDEPEPNPPTQDEKQHQNHD